MSNRLTFSLASLVLIFALAFAGLPVLAEVGGPTVEIKVLGTAMRDNIDVSFTFTPGVTGFGDSGDAQWQLYDKDGVLLDSATALTPTADNSDTTGTTEANPKVWYANNIDVTGATSIADAVGILISVPADGANGNLAANTKGNQSASKEVDLPPLVAEGTLVLAVAKADPQITTTDGEDYVLTLTYTDASDAAAAPSTVPDVSHLTFTPSFLGAALLNGATGAIPAEGTTTGVYELPIVYPTGAPPVMIGVQPSYIKGVKAVRVPEAPTVDPAAPMVAIDISGHDATEREFRIEVTITPQPKSDGSAGDKVATTNGANGFITKISAKDSNDGTVLLTESAGRGGDNMYTGILKYDRLATLPITLSIDPNGLVSGSKPDVDPVTAMVGMAESTNNAPMFAADTATRSIAENTAAGMAIGDPVTATDADNDTLTYALGGTDMASFAIVSTSGQLQTMAPLDYEMKTSYMVTVTADDGNGGTDSIAVTINVTDVVEGTDNMPPAFAADLPATLTGKTGVTIQPVTFSATDPDGDTIAYSWDVDETALGLMLDAATGTVSGTPNKVHSASHVITATATGGMDTHTVMVNITGNTAPTFEPYTFPTLTKDMAHPVTLPAATDPDGDALNYSISGSLPAGLRASAAGDTPLTIQGTPTAVGTSSVTYMASDGRGGEATLALTITVNPAPEKPDEPDPGAPNAPTGLMATTNANNTVTLTWTEPNGATSYIVEVKTVGATTTTTDTIQGSASSHTTGVLSAGTYTIRVAARNAEGTGGSTSVTVSIPAAPQTPEKPPAILLPAGIPDVGGSFAAGTGRVVGTTTLRGSIAADSFGVVLADDLPNLEQFFRMTGTIVLNDGKSAATEGLGTRAVLISEILWGLDAGEPAGMQDRRQFIELYNTSKSGAAPLDVTGWTLTFTLHRTAPANVVDRVSNTGLSVDPGWVMDIGQSGVLTGTTLAGVSALGGQGVPVDIISAYRNINYGGVQGGDLKADHVRWGHQKGSWKASTRITTQVGIKASPGARHFTVQGPLSKTNVPFSPFVINEIGNATGGANDWIEIRNVTDSVQSLKNYQLSVVTSDKKDTALFTFHDQDYKVPAKGVILITHSDPSTNDLAGGNNAAKGDLDEVLEGATHLYVVPTKGPNSGKFNIPDSGKILLILRKNHEGKHLGTGNEIVDVVGTLSIQDVSRGTNLWPLYVWGGPHSNVVKNGDEDFRAGKVYQRNNTNADGKEAIEIRGYTGVGYDRHAAVSDENGGTPGYDNGAVKHKYSDFSGQISVSEIMLVTEEERMAGRVPRATRLPQWIELYNNSMTQGVTISNWHLEIQNDDTEGFLGNLHGTLRLPNIVIPPNQTVLIVSASGLNSGNFPPQRTVNVFLNGTWRRELGLVSRGDVILNPVGFYVEIRDHENRLVDDIGNLGVSRRTGMNRRDNFGSEWEIPSLHSVDGHRTSLVRIYDNGTAEDGLMKDSWRRAADTNFRNVPSLTYYGNHRDFGTPGYRGGGPLPVSLSKFRPERLESGEIAIRWITESELNNAGFNILRSETRNGEFKQINTKLIAGQGTTSERHTYEWKDTTAKPNVVYYYQIQDVSIDGKVQPLQISRLKGHVSPAGKATTTWGELKALQ